MTAPHLSLSRVSRELVCRLVTTFLIVTIGSGVALAASKPAWVEVRSPNFIVVSNAGEGQARRTARQFEMIRAVFRIWFAQKGDSTEQPVIILAAKDESTLKSLIPEFWAQRGAAHPAGIYLGGTDADYIALRLDVSLSEQAYEPFEPVYHEYVHYLTRRLIARLPLWLVEGLAEFFGNTQILNKEVFVGAPSKSNLILLNRQPMLPVSKLFEIDASSPYYHEENKTSIFYSESWALTHYLMARDWQENTHRMNAFVQLLDQGADAKEAAARTIGNPSSFDDPLRRYVARFTLDAKRLEPPKIDENGFRVRGMTDAEALAVRADFMAHDHHFSEARQMLEEALKSDPKLAVAYDGLSFVALQQGKAQDAEKWSSQGLKIDAQDYRANFYYAWSLLRAGRYDEDSLGKAEASLRAALKANPEFVPAYDALAYALSMEGGKEKLDEAYMMTLQAVTREPGNVRYRIRAVEVLERQSRFKDAIRVANLAVSMAKTQEERLAATAALDAAQRAQDSWENIQAIEKSHAEQDGKVESLKMLHAGSTPPAFREVNAAMEALMLSNPQGVDFNSYLGAEVMPKIQREWAARIQKVMVAAESKKGTAIFEFAIDKDGSAREIRLKQSAQDEALDDALREAIEGASPFSPLPAKFRGQHIALRLKCDYSPRTAGQDAAAERKKESGEKPGKN